MTQQLDPKIQQTLRRGTVIPAHPLALDAKRRLDERRQRALTRYYIAAGAGGLAVGVHTTQFAIRNPKIALLEPVLQIAREEMDRAEAGRGDPLIRIGGICGDTAQAAREAWLLADLRYSAGLLSLAALKETSEAALLAHCREIAQILPVVGFYLQPAVGGRDNFVSLLAPVRGIGQRGRNQNRTIQSLSNAGRRTRGGGVGPRHRTLHWQRRQHRA